jgi:hypothetical protein
MMKNLILVVLFCFSTSLVFAQAKSDSLAYQFEHKKINDMLARRTTKFGQYDQSLSMHTGIFGMQTKKDIRRSNDILMDIVKTDDSIYRELKILFEFSVFQRTQIQDHSKEAEDSNIGFMTTINKLRAQVDNLKADAEKQQQQEEKTKRLFIVALIIMSALIVYLIGSKSKRKA